MRMRALLGAGFAAFAASGVARAEQVVVFDAHWTHTAETPDSHYRLPPLEGTPANWVSPVNYANGTAHVHLEVLTKPTATPTKFQVCFEATPTYACTAQSDQYTTTGVLDWATPFAAFWSPPNESVDWTQGTRNIAAILKDTVNGKPSAANVGPETAALYTPTEVRMVVTLVSPGGDYVPPDPYEPPAPDAGPEAGVAADAALDAPEVDGDGAGGAASHSGGAGAGGARGGASNAGAPSASAGGARASGGSPAVPEAGPGPGDNGPALSRPHEDDGGCAITAQGPSAPSGATWAGVFALFTGAFARRRSRRTFLSSLGTRRRRSG
jgi:hypothetical protein